MREAACLSKRLRTTTETYDAIAADYRENTRDFTRGLAWLERFLGVVPAGSLVADLGSGPGRDTALLRARGIDAFCVDVSLGMLSAGRDEYPASRVQASLLSLPLHTSSIDGAWANASLHHLSTAELRSALSEIHRVVVPNGHVHVTVKRGEGSEWESSRYGRPRWFKYWSGVALDRELVRAGLTPVFASEEESTRSSWIVRLCRVEPRASAPTETVSRAR